MRTTKSHLHAIIERINKITNSPLTPYANINGKTVANVGNYHLSGAYGGNSLLRMETDGGGARDVLRCGHIPKARLADLMHAFIAGLNER